MSWRSRPSAWSVLLAVALVSPGRVVAQGWRETQVGVAGFGSRPAVGVAGAGLAWRDQGRTRVGGALMLGSDENGGLVGRAEAAWHFLLDPSRRAGNGVYAGGGVSVALSGGRARPYVLLVVGAENAPAGRRGTFIEAGVGGGIRLAAGMRWRKQNAPSR
ncbi:MAG: hypothetical protein Q8Q85_06710 [Gemmatimonadales bacterium]|nr:hypothetical protein [Gemmatimonadales bacterium]